MIKNRVRNSLHAFTRFLNSLQRSGKASNLKRLHRRGETIESFLIREGTIADIPKLAALHVRAWNETYWLVRKTPTYEVREWQWTEQFKDNSGRWFVFVVQDKNGELVGFAKGKTYHHDDLPQFGGYGWSDLQKLAPLCLGEKV
jgi:RimJ/RimL family protein N-acetyltransferase